MESFPQEAHKKLDWYVYRLIDPRNGSTFYVGKGVDDRVFAHARGALTEEIDDNDAGVMNLKHETIRDIVKAGLKPLHVIHRHGMKTEEIAFEVEAALIDAYPGLTNIVGGHGSSLRGCRSVQQIAAAYAAPPLVAHEPLILIYIGIARDERRNVYDAVRGVWKMSKAKAEENKLILAYDGVLVVGAFRPNRWLPGTKANFPFLSQDRPDRIGFEGVDADVDVASKYIGHRVPPRRKGGCESLPVSVAARPERVNSAPADCSVVRGPTLGSSAPPKLMNRFFATCDY